MKMYSFEEEKINSTDNAINYIFREQIKNLGGGRG